MTKYVIINSDDFGISEGVNRGVLEAHKQGVLTSTCTMVNMPASGDGIRQAQQKAPRLGVGLHLTLSFGQPVLSADVVPSLVDVDGQFPQTYDGLMQRLLHFDPVELANEIQAQFDRFVALAGKLPTHIDSHHRGAYLHPASFEVMCRLCAEHNLPMRRPAWLDHPAINRDISLNADGQLNDKLRNLYEKHGSPRCPDQMADTFQWGRGDRLPLFESVLSQVQDGYTEIICHVGYAEGLHEAYAEPREDELVAMCHPQLQNIVEANQLQLVSFAELPES